VKLYAPELSFRGTRNYIHSTDLYEHLLAGSVAAGVGGVDGPIVLKFRRRIASQPEYAFQVAGDETSGASSEFVLTIGGEPVRGVIRESGRPVDRRREYDERSIWDAAAVSGNTITGRPPSGTAPIEAVTALGVLHLRTLFPPPDGSRWMLARIDLKRPLDIEQLDPVTIVLRQQVVGRMTRSVIEHPGGSLGSMEFVLANG
jgi:hypothetical protein